MHRSPRSLPHRLLTGCRGLLQSSDRWTKVTCVFHFDVPAIPGAVVTPILSRLTNRQYPSPSSLIWNAVTTLHNQVYFDAGIKVLTLAQNAYTLWLAQPQAEKRKLLNLLQSNCTFDGVSLTATYKKTLLLCDLARLQKGL